MVDGVVPSSEVRLPSTIRPHWLEPTICFSEEDGLSRTTSDGVGVDCPSMLTVAVKIQSDKIESNTKVCVFRNLCFQKLFELSLFMWKHLDVGLQGVQMKKPYNSEPFILKLLFSVRIFWVGVKFKYQHHLLIFPMHHFADHTVFFLLNAFPGQLTFFLFFFVF